MRKHSKRCTSRLSPSSAEGAVVTETRRKLTPPFVKSDADRLDAALVVRPSALLAQEPPMQGESSPIVERALEQHEIFLGRLRSLGVAVTVLDGTPDVPLAVCVDDLAVMFSDGAVLMRPSDLKRRREVNACETMLTELGIPIVGRIEPPGLLDGGDVLVANETLFIGVAQDRSALSGVVKPPHGNAHGRAQLAALGAVRGLKLAEVVLSSTVRRLRAVASLVDSQTILYAPHLVDATAFAKWQTIEVPSGEDYGAGVLCLGNRRVLANVRFCTVAPLLRKAKITVDSIDLWEFGKAGITPSSLALALKRA
jgi:dimethylargininase